MTLVCTSIAFVATYRGTGTQLRKQIDSELSGDANELSRTLAQVHSPTPARLVSAASTYVRNQPFGATSTLLFVSVAGAGTATNRPELFAGAEPDNGETQAVQASEGRSAAGLVGAREGYSTERLLDVGRLRLLKRTLALGAGARAVIGVGEPLATVSHAQEGVARAFVLAGVLALAGALLASFLIGTRVSRPLRRMASVATRVGAGDLRPRITDTGGEGTEVEVLADAFNHMLDRLTEAFASQRAFVADASHELRTPLTVIRGQLEVLASEREPSAEDVQRVERLVRAEIDRISRLVDDLLLLAQTEQQQFLRIERVPLAAFVRELWDGLSLVATRRFELSELPLGTLRADPDRLAQALRNLLANAIEHTREPDGVVRLRVEADARRNRVRFCVEDDGPGIAPEERERVFDRFHRTDGARDRRSGGTGLGLAIVRAIAQAHGGRVSVGESREGGASFELELPGFDAYGTSTAAPLKRPARKSSSASAAASSG
ncbi:MAG TPA: HAMP domain-containing sensor histidine kinase [Solirubrobacteraceae bacterium]|nr:HAMP domain-containing sensor histidine kinase [Solirubrobacteraceae bacterium]